MEQPLQICYRDFPKSEALDEIIREKAAKLDQYYEKIMACRIVVEQPHHHHRQGNLFHIRIDLTVPGKEIVVKRDPPKHQAHEDPYVTVNDAFDAMRRQLQDFARRQRGDVKHHEQPPHGKIIEVVPMMDSGTIMSSDGREIYFHRNSVIDGDLDDLEVGDEVWFAEETTVDGTHATTVHVVGKHHRLG